MSTVSTKHKKKCSSCSKPIQKMQKFIECLGCNNLFHAVPACTKSLNLNDSNIIPTIDLCQHCLAETLPFQTLDESEYEFTMNGNNISEDDMDRLRHLKFDTITTLRCPKITQISINRLK